MVLNGVCGRLTMKTERHEKGNRTLAQSRVEVGVVRNHRSVGDAGSSDVLNSCRKTELGACFCSSYTFRQEKWHCGKRSRWPERLILTANVNIYTRREYQVSGANFDKLGVEVSLSLIGYSINIRWITIITVQNTPNTQTYVHISNILPATINQPWKWSLAKLGYRSCRMWEFVITQTTRMDVSLRDYFTKEKETALSHQPLCLRVHF